MLTLFTTIILAFARSSYEFEFSNFISTYQKQYSSPLEFNYRKGIFSQNLNLIKEHNENNYTWQMDINEWADQTWEEFSFNRLGGSVSIQPSSTLIKFKSSSTFFLPEHVDWREKNVVTPVKDQAQCGSCWAFSTTGAVESAVALKKGSLISLSEQELVDCANNGNYGCNGGLMTQAFDWIRENNGLCSEQDYSYTAKNGNCRKSNCQAVSSITSYQNVESNNQLALKQRVAQQPVSVAIEADQSGFQFYKSGVFSGKCGTNLDHGVLLVGYGSENGVDYWLVKNSWGASWGDQGYIKLVRSDENSPGQCGIAMMASFPIV